MMTPEYLRTKFSAALPYDAYVASGKPEHREAWGRTHARVALTPGQRELLGSFTRKLHVLTISGTWCGDCAQQCPMYDHIARATRGVVELRFVDREAHRELSDRVKICGGNRVPTTLFLNEDFEFCGLASDKAISRLRAMAAKALGASCPVPGAGLAADEAAATLADWVTQFEWMHLLVRMSPKLREKHGD